MFDYKTYADHNGRNPSHVPGGYTRHIEVPIDPKNLLLGTRRVYVRPRNPSRWLPHVGGSLAGPRINPPVAEIVTRQQRRYAERMEAERLRREENARVHSAHRRSRRRAA